MTVRHIPVGRGRFAISYVKIALLAAILLAGAATNAFANGSISGNVSTNTNPPVPLANTGIQFYDLLGNDGDAVATATTDASGNYTINLPASTYAVLTQDTHGYINEIYDGIHCSTTCDVDSLTPVVVTNGPVTGINFLLDPGGRIFGHISSSVAGNPPIAGVRVFFVDSNAQVAFTSAVTNALGDYTSDGGAAAGNAYAVTMNTQGYQDEIYDDIHCMNCEITTGTAIAVAGTGLTGPISFQLDPGGRITGTVKDASNNPLPNVEVHIATPTGNTVGDFVTDASGFYSTAGFPVGTYYAYTRNTLGFVDELYDNLPCLNGNCPVNNGVTTATSIAVGGGGTIASGKDFVLAPGGTITGTVTRASNGAALSDVFVGIFQTVSTPGPTFGQLQFLGGDNTNELGVYSVVAPAGTFFAAVFQVNGFANQVYSGMPCADNNCPVNAGTPINVTTGQTTGNIDFRLVAGPGTISGTLTNGSVGGTINNAQVQLFTSTGASAGGAFTNGSGFYTITGLAPGSYYLRTNVFGTVVNQLYNGVPCIQCNVAASGGTLIQVTSGGTATINFALLNGGRISGTITNAAGGALLTGVPVQIFSTAGLPMGTVNSASPSGTYSSQPIPAGTYYVRTAVTPTQNFVDELWNDIPCVPCTVTAGVPVTVTGTGTTPAINFALSPGGSISGTVTNAAGGAPLASIGVIVFDSTGVLVKNTTTDGSGNYALTGLLPGNYFVRTNPNAATQNFVTQMYDGIPFAGNTTTATPVAVVAGTAHTGVNFALASGGSLSGSVKATGTNAPLPGVQVTVYLPTGKFVKNVNTDTFGNFTITGLQAGSYYVSTSAPSFLAPFFVDELYDNFPCVGCQTISGAGFPLVTLPCAAPCTPLVTGGTAVVITNGTTRTGVNFLLDPGAGVIQGFVTSAANGIGLLNVQVSIYNSAGVVVKSVTTGANFGAYTVRGLAPGTYYARTIVSPATPYYTDVTYGNTPCVLCNVTATSAPITVTANATTTANFALPSGGSITGLVSDTATANPLASVDVQLFNAAGNLVKTTFTGVSGTFGFDGLSAGTYFARTVVPGGSIYVDELFDNIPCVSCAVTSGTPILVANAATRAGVNFALSTNFAPTITGVSNRITTVNTPVVINFTVGDVESGPAGVSVSASSSNTTLVPNANLVLGGTGAARTLTITPAANQSSVTTITLTAGDGIRTTSASFVLLVGSLRRGGDFDGDNRSDVAVFRPSNGTWYIRNSGTGLNIGLIWGGVGDVPVPGDYDRDGLADMAVFRPSNGTWYIRQSSTGALVASLWGGVGDVPVQGDYDGDGRTDIAVFRASSGVWYIRNSATGLDEGLLWGGPGDVPAPGDYDADGKTDMAVFRASNGTWYLRSSTTGALTASVWGGVGDVAVSGDYDGDGRTDIAVFRPSSGVWYIRNSSTGLDEGLLWGGLGDVPVPADYDGDGKTDMAVFRPSNGTWYLRSSATGQLTTVVWGGVGDIPVLRK